MSVGPGRARHPPSRSSLDREILALALPARGALAADPLVSMCGHGLRGPPGRDAAGRLAAVAGSALLLVLPMGWGLEGFWWGIVALMGARGLTLGLRYWNPGAPGRATAG